jgi:hypothetical protein
VREDLRYHLSLLDARKALADADTAYRLPDGSLAHDGPGGSVTLYIQ